MVIGLVGLLSNTAIPTVTGVGQGLSAQQQQMRPRRNQKKFISPLSLTGQLMEFYFQYPSQEQHLGLVSSIQDDRPMLNWIYVDADSGSLCHGGRKHTIGHIIGPWGWSDDEKLLILKSSAEFTAKNEEVTDNGETWVIHRLQSGHQRRNTTTCTLAVDCDNIDDIASSNQGISQADDVVGSLSDKLARVHISDSTVNISFEHMPENQHNKEARKQDWGLLDKSKTATRYGNNLRAAVGQGTGLYNTYHKLVGNQDNKQVTQNTNTNNPEQEHTQREQPSQDTSEPAGAHEATASEIQAISSIQLEYHDELQPQAETHIMPTSDHPQSTPSEAMTTELRNDDGGSQVGNQETNHNGSEGMGNSMSEQVGDGGPFPRENMHADETAMEVVDENGMEEAGDHNEKSTGSKRKIDEADTNAIDSSLTSVPRTGDSPLNDAMQEPTGNAEQTVNKDTRDASGDAIQDKTDDVALSILNGAKVNKAGNLVNEKGGVVGRIADGDRRHLVGETADAEGQLWNSTGQVVGQAELVPESEREQSSKDFAPLENFPNAVVEVDGQVTSDGKRVGTVTEGETKRMRGAKVDEDGDILDRRGNFIGKAEIYDEPEEAPQKAADLSALAGKRVKKTGNVVDTNGQLYGHVIEGDAKSLVGRMCDKQGNILSESGDKVGKAELVSEAEREGCKEGPFSGLSRCTAAKDGKVVTESGETVGRLTTGEPKTLFSREIDEDGDVVDKNGNSLGRAERWQEPEVEKEKSPLENRKVNREGNVVDDDGNIIAKLVNGDVATCAGKTVDQDGDLSLPKIKEKRDQAGKDQELASTLGNTIEQSLDKIKPILKMITDKIDAAEQTPKEELGEEALAKEVKPLIEEGGILSEVNGVVRGMNSDGRIQRNAKHGAGTKEATPEEHHPAEMLKEVSINLRIRGFSGTNMSQLAGNITETIDNDKRKTEGMAHAKKELNPLWGLLNKPLVQIIAAVGLLLSGVLSLVGRLLSGLGLGGLVDGLLGGLGLDKLLGNLGLGGFTGNKDKNGGKRLL
ncbi:hypothetical protein PWT90_00446 [Aphanocladium album]|nr:hypothetical protein PWT90_00446 [Aphanocladium album]